MISVSVMWLEPESLGQLRSQIGLRYVEMPSVVVGYLCRGFGFLRIVGEPEAIRKLAPLL